MNTEDICAVNGSKWRVIGIDPAPKKPSAICYYDNENLVFKALKTHELLKLMNDLKSQKNILITWDAPLTGPPILEHGGEEHPECYFYHRCIETFFRKNEDFKTPAGISTLGYAGCPHWAITKAATGLPILGPYCSRSEVLPFHHIVSDENRLSEQKPNIIEVHPAAAIYFGLHFSGQHEGIKDWRYKKYKSVRKELFEKLMATFFKDIPIKIDFGQIKSDDHLDAFVGWALGYLYAQGKKEEVQILGNRCTGSMLLPHNKGLTLDFYNFIKSRFKENKDDKCK